MTGASILKIALLVCHIQKCSFWFLSSSLSQANYVPKLGKNKRKYVVFSIFFLALFVFGLCVPFALHLLAALFNQIVCLRSRSHFEGRPETLSQKKRV